MPDQVRSSQQARASSRPSLLEPGSIPATNGGLLMLGAFIAATLLAGRATPTDQDIASRDLSTAAEAYQKAKNRLVAAIIEADRNDLGRNEIARRVDGIYSRQTVLTLLGSADLVQRAAVALEEHDLTSGVRVWQGKRQRLLMELTDMDNADEARLRTSQAAVRALIDAGVGVRTGSTSSPAEHLASGKVLELLPNPA
jgi:hypothetical protein